jgi:hypothetical protein
MVRVAAALAQRGLQVQSSSGSFCFVLRPQYVAHEQCLQSLRFGHLHFVGRRGKQVCTAA